MMFLDADISRGGSGWHPLVQMNVACGAPHSMPKAARLLSSWPEYGCFIDSVSRYVPLSTHTGDPAGCRPYSSGCGCRGSRLKAVEGLGARIKYGGAEETKDRKRLIL